MLKLLVELVLKQGYLNHCIIIHIYLVLILGCFATCRHGIIRVSEKMDEITELTCKYGI